MKTHRHGLAIYYLILDGLAQEAGALYRPLFEALNMLIYIKRNPSEAQRALLGDWVALRYNDRGGVTMPARKQQPTHWYSVYVVAYVDEATRIRVERGEEVVTQPRQITVQNFYMGTSRQKANATISRAVISAANNPLAYAVVMEQDHQTIIRLRVEH